MIRYDYQSPIGVLALVADDAALRGLSFEGGKHGGPPADAQQGTNAIIDATRRQLDAYFAGRSKAFDLPLAPDGTDFQKRVWRVLATIPFGETRSYGEIAATIGDPRASRALARRTDAIRSPSSSRATASLAPTEALPVLAAAWSASASCWRLKVGNRRCCGREDLRSTSRWGFA